MAKRSLPYVVLSGTTLCIAAAYPYRGRMGHKPDPLIPTRGAGAHEQRESAIEGDL